MSEVKKVEAKKEVSTETTNFNLGSFSQPLIDLINLCGHMAESVQHYFEKKTKLLDIEIQNAEAKQVASAPTSSELKEVKQSITEVITQQRIVSSRLNKVETRQKSWRDNKTQPHRSNNISKKSSIPENPMQEAEPQHAKTEELSVTTQPISEEPKKEVPKFGNNSLKNGIMQIASMQSRSG